MKRIIALLLCLLLTALACGCGSQETEQDEYEGKFTAGFARVDITPKWSVPLGGYGNVSKRMSTSVTNYIYASCTALTDTSGQTILMYSIDLIDSDHASECREAIAGQLGVPASNIFFTATHTHSAPSETLSLESAANYYNSLLPLYIQAGQKALDDRKPAQLFKGSVETEHLNFVRHYQSTSADGKINYFGDNFGTAVYDETTKHVTEIDPTMYLLKITREGDKDIVIANWRGHPALDGGASKYNVSSDFAGTFRTAMELQLDCEFMFLQGAAGNVNAATRLSEESRASNSDVHGKLLADHAITALESMEEVPITTFRLSQVIWDGPVDHSTDSMVPQAMLVANVWQSTGIYADAAATGAPYGIRSPYQANAIISRAKMEANSPAELNVVMLSEDLAIATSPCEMFDTTGVEIEQASPAETTLVLGYTNGMRGYIPSSFGFEYTCYESDTCRYEPGCAEVIRDMLIGLLNE